MAEEKKEPIFKPRKDDPPPFDVKKPSDPPVHPNDYKPPPKPKK